VTGCTTRVQFPAGAVLLFGVIKLGPSRGLFRPSSNFPREWTWRSELTGHVCLMPRPRECMTARYLHHTPSCIGVWLRTEITYM